MSCRSAASRPRSILAPSSRMMTSLATIWAEARAQPVLPRCCGRWPQRSSPMCSSPAAISIAVLHFARDLRGVRHRPEHLHGLRRTGVVRPQRLRGDQRLHIRGAHRRPMAGSRLPRRCASACSARSPARSSSATRRCACAAITSRWRHSRSASSSMRSPSQWQSVTQGYMGISGIPPLGIGRFTVTSDRALLVWLVAFAAARRCRGRRHPPLAARPRLRRHRRQRGRGARARHRCRALQAASPS